jgi:hypothetical protein
MVPHEYRRPRLQLPQALLVNINPHLDERPHEPLEALGRRPLAQPALADDLEARRRGGAVGRADDEPAEVGEAARAEAAEARGGAAPREEGGEGEEEEGEGRVGRDGVEEEGAEESHGCGGGLVLSWGVGSIGCAGRRG